MNFYYITYYVSCDSSGLGSSYVHMGALEDYDIAEKYIVQDFYDQHQEVFIESSETENEYEFKNDYNAFPRLVTNDPRFYLLYKGVYSPTEFQLFCNVKDGSSELTPQEKYKLEVGRGSYDIYDQFLKLIKGEAKFAYEYESYETEYDEDSGISYSMPVDSGWRFRNNYLENDRIRQRFNLR